jgi:hypothetical protein
MIPALILILVAIDVALAESTSSPGRCIIVVAATLIGFWGINEWKKGRQQKGRATDAADLVR